MRYAKILALFLCLMLIGVPKIQSQDNVEPPKSSTKIRQKDGMKMVYIPAGTFMMGTSDGQIQQLLRDNPAWKASSFDDEKPVHQVYTDAFYMDEHEVTNEQYCIFLNDYAVGHKLLDLDDEDCLIEKVGNTYRPKSSYAKHPVIEVSWYGAAAYAQWAGVRLPTEAQWEKAARGGLVGKKYPWGDDIDPSKANYDADDLRPWSVESLLKYLKPVGSFPANGYGLFDMAGNVWEWCADEYKKGYYSQSPPQNPTGPGAAILFVSYDFMDVKSSRVFRGGSWFGNGLDILRCAYRSDGGVPRGTDFRIGFRCCSR